MAFPGLLHVVDPSVAVSLKSDSIAVQREGTMTTVAQIRKLQQQFEDQGYVILPALIEPQVQAAV